MKASTFWLRIVPPVCGLAIGLLMSGVMTIRFLHDMLRTSPGLGRIYDVIHFPAWGLVGLWRWLGLPPSGDAGFILYPSAVVAQWFLIGIIVSIVVWLRFRGTPATN
jgi:hypothetical protein